MISAFKARWFGNVAEEADWRKARFVQMAFGRAGWQIAHGYTPVPPPEPLTEKQLKKLGGIGPKAAAMIAPLRPVWSQEHHDWHGEWAK